VAFETDLVSRPPRKKHAAPGSAAWWGQVICLGVGWGRPRMLEVSRHQRPCRREPWDTPGVLPAGGASPIF